MPVLNTADALYLGASAVSAAYYGTNQVWPSGPLGPSLEAQMQALFASLGHQGGMYAVRPEYVFKDTAGTIAGVVNEEILRINDLSALGNHLLQPTAGQGFILRGSPTLPPVFEDDFSDGDTAGWGTSSTTLSVVAGKLRITCAVAGAVCVGNAPFTTIVGHTYRVRGVWTSSPSKNWRVAVGTSSIGTNLYAPTLSSSGTTYGYFTATGTTTYIVVRSGSTMAVGDYCDVDDIVVEDVTAGYVQAPYCAEADVSDDFMCTAASLTFGPTCYFAVAGAKLGGSNGLFIAGNAATNRVGLLNATTSGRYLPYMRASGTIYANLASDVDAWPDMQEAVADAFFQPGFADGRVNGVEKASGAVTLSTQSVTGPLGVSGFGGSSQTQLRRFYGGVAIAGDPTSDGRTLATQYLASVAGVSL